MVGLCCLQTIGLTFLLRMKFGLVFFACGGNRFGLFYLQFPPPGIGFGLSCLWFPEWKRTQTQNVGPDIFRWGGGSSTGRRASHKLRYVPRNSGKKNFLEGVNLHRAIVSQPQKQNQPPTLWNIFAGSAQNNFVSLPRTLLRVNVHCPDSLMCPSHRTLEGAVAELMTSYHPKGQNLLKSSDCLGATCQFWIPFRRPQLFCVSICIFVQSFLKSMKIPQTRKPRTKTAKARQNHKKWRRNAQVTTFHNKIQ